MKEKAKKVLILLSAIYFLSTIIHYLYFNNLDIFNLTKTQSNLEWYIRVVRDVSLICFIFIQIVVSIAYYFLSKRTFRDKLEIIFPILLNLGLIFLSYYTYRVELRLYNLYQHMINIPQTIEANNQLINSKKINLSKKIELSHNFANIVFIHSNKRIKVINKSGKIEQYQPTKEDLKEAIKLKKLNSIEKYKISSLKSAYYLWISLLIISIVVGFIYAFFLIKRDKNLNNKSISI